MLDFEVQRFTRRCATSDRDLKPGEEFYSVLVAEGAEVSRKDISAEAWNGPPEKSLGWWKSRVPDAKSRRLHWAPNDVMLNYFLQLENETESQDVRYILTLLMIRRRVLRLEDSVKEENGHEFLEVYCPRNESEYRIQVIEPDAERAVYIQDDLAKLLFARAS